MKPRWLFAISAGVCGVTGYLGVSQAGAYVDGKSDPTTHRPRTNGVFLGGYYYYGVASPVYRGPSTLRANDFRGGGPSAGK